MVNLSNSSKVYDTSPKINNTFQSKKSNEITVSHPERYWTSSDENYDDNDYKDNEDAMETLVVCTLDPWDDDWWVMWTKVVVWALSIASGDPVEKLGCKHCDKLFVFEKELRLHTHEVHGICRVGLSRGTRFATPCPWPDCTTPWWDNIKWLDDNHLVG